MTQEAGSVEVAVRANLSELEAGLGRGEQQAVASGQRMQRSLDGVSAATGRLSAASADLAASTQAASAAQDKAIPALRSVEAAAKRVGISVEEMQARIDAVKQNGLTGMFAGVKAGGDQAAGALGKAQVAAAGFSEEQAKTIFNYETQIGKSYLLSQGLGREAAQFTALRKAGTTANTQYGQTVATLAGQVYDLDQQQRKAEASSGHLANTLTRRFLYAVAISQIRQLASSLIGLNQELVRTADIGRLTGTGSSLIQGLTSAAGYKGVRAPDFSTAMVAFNQQIPLAKAGVGALGDLLRANQVTVSNTTDAFFKIADLVKSAKDETAQLSILQQAGLPATMQMAQFMAQGASAIKQQAADAYKLSDAALEAAKRIDDRFNKLWTDFKVAGKGAVVEVADGWIAAWNRPFMDPSTLLGGWFEKLKQQAWGAPFGGMLPKTVAPLPASPVGAVEFGGNLPPASGANRQTRDWATEKAIAEKRISDEQQLLSLYGMTTSATEARRQVELQFQQAALSGINIDAKRAEVIKRLTYENALGISAIKANTDALRIDITVTGMAVGPATRYRAEQELINAAHQKGIELTSKMRAEIAAVAKVYGEVAEQAAKMRLASDIAFGRNTALLSPGDVQIAQALKDIYPDVATALKSVEAQAMRANAAISEVANKISSQLTTSLADVLDGTKNLADGFRDFAQVALRAIEEMIIKLLIVEPLMRSLQAGLSGLGGGAGAGAGGLLGGLIIPGILHDGGIAGSAPSSGRLLPSDIFVSAPRFHSGRVPFGPNEMPAILDKREEVGYPAQLAAKYGGGSKTVNVNMTIDLAGANGDETIAQIAGAAAVQATQAGIEQFSKTGLPARLQTLKVRGA